MLLKSKDITSDYLNTIHKVENKIPMICPGCDSVFTRTKGKCQAAIKNKTIMYCTIQCFAKTQRKEEKIDCLECGVEFSIKMTALRKSKTGKLFCSQLCANKYSAKQRVKSNNCLSCNKEIAGSKKFCNSKCQQDLYWEDYKKEIENNNGFEKENRPMARKYLIDKVGYKCSICNITEWAGKPAPLVCDHVDGDSNNNKLDNLRLICQNCNALLPTFASGNRGKGRQSKKIAYQKEKMGITEADINEQISRKVKQIVLKTKICPICLNNFQAKKPKQIYCGQDCHHKDDKFKKVQDRPGRDKLIEMINETSLTAVGRLFGVNSNTVKKWIT